MICSCGRVKVETDGARLTLSAQETTATATLMNQGGQLKVEHLACQMCVTVEVRDVGAQG